MKNIDHINNLSKWIVENSGKFGIKSKEDWVTVSHINLEREMDFRRKMIAAAAIALAALEHDNESF